MHRNNINNKWTTKVTSDNPGIMEVRTDRGPGGGRVKVEHLPGQDGADQHQAEREVENVGQALCPAVEWYWLKIVINTCQSPTVCFM